MSYCRECGTEIEPDAMFCKSCGTEQATINEERLGTRSA